MPLTSKKDIQTCINELQRKWHEEIPITRFMELTIVDCNTSMIRLSQPLSPNINVHKTMFAGSIYTLATLCGWGAVHLAMNDCSLDGSIVLSEGSIDYKKPIQETPLAVSEWSSLQIDSTKLVNGRNVAVNVEVPVYTNEELAAVFHGTYVVLPKS